MKKRGNPYCQKHHLFYSVSCQLCHVGLSAMPKKLDLPQFKEFKDKPVKKIMVGKGKKKYKNSR